MEERERLKKSIIEFIDYLEKVERDKGKGNGFLSYLIQEDRTYTKDFYLMYEKNSLAKKSKNIIDFVNHRKHIQSSSIKSLFENSVDLPKVLRFNHLQKMNTDEYKEIKDVISYSSLLRLGCHNIADRISISNPTKYKSIRTMFSFPHWGMNEEIKEITKGELTPIMGDSDTYKRLIDKNGNIWINHSISVVKDGNQWIKSFPDEENVIPDWADKNEKLFKILGNGVAVDVDILGFRNRGLYDSIKYKVVGEFDFEGFNEEEILWVKRYLDWEFISLQTFIQKNDFEYYNHKGEDEKNVYDDYLSVLKELAEEKSYTYIRFLILPDIMENVVQKLNSNPYDFEFAKGVLNSMNLNVAKVGESVFKESFESLCERWETTKKKEKKWQDGFWKKVDLTDNFSLVPTDESLMDIKRKDLTNNFINQTIDFPSKKIKTKRTGSSSSNELRRLLRIFGIK